MFEKELDFFISNQTKLFNQYPGKVLALQGEKILGVYDSIMQAFVECSNKFPAGTFMLQSCIEGPSAYTVNISSINLFPN